jgi:hypothetical protein
MWFRSGGSRGFLAGFVIASLLFGGIAMAEEIVQREIRVSYLPLKYMFDGVEKAPPADQQGFTYNGRTFVPLRFMGDALGKAIEYDPATYTIYVGRRPGPLPDLWKTYKTEGDATIKAEYFSAGALTRVGAKMPDTMLFTALAAAPASTEPAVLTQTSSISTEITLDLKYKTLSGTLFVPDSYFGHPETRQIARITVINELNQVLYQSPVLETNSSPTPFTLPVNTAKKVRIYVTFYHNQGFAVGTSLVSSHIGLSNLKWE